MQQHDIEINGAHEGPLDNVDLDLPLGKLICFVGRSGSGARTMAIDVLLAESRRRYMMALSAFERERLGGLAEVAVEEVRHLPPALLIPGAIRAGTSVSRLLQISQPLIELFAAVARIHCKSCGAGECRSFSPGEGADALIHALSGESCLIVAPLTLDRDAAIDATLAEIQRAGYSRLWMSGKLIRVEELSAESTSEIAAASDVGVVVDRLKVESARSARISEAIRNAQLMARGYATAVTSDSGRQIWLNRQLTCDACGQKHDDIRWDLVEEELGSGQELQLDAVVADTTLRDIDSFTISEAIEFCDDALSGVLEVAASAEAEGLVREIESSLSRSAALDLGHLRLNQDVASLSSGEWLRLSLASAASRGLLGLLYVVDMPVSILDVRAREKTLELLRDLVRAGNTAVLLDNDSDVVNSCDLVVPFRAGSVQQGRGGSVTVLGSKERAPRRAIHPSSVNCVMRASGVGNIPEAELTFPVGAFVSIVGDSGAGKTVLLRDVIQAGMKAAMSRGRTARPIADAGGSSVCLEQGGLRRQTVIDRDVPGSGDHVVLRTLGLFSRLAALYARTPAATERGYTAEFFELERPGGRCTVCEGLGRLRYDLEFLEDLTLACPSCLGRRYREEVLEVTVKGHSMADILELSIGSAHRLFSRERALAGRFQASVECGLGSLCLGDRTGDLESAQVLQLKLAVALDGASEKDLVLVDHPGAGLHPEDLRRMLASLRQLVDRGSTVVVADSQPEVRQEADWIIAIGPGRGPDGGRICYCGNAADFET